MQKISVQLYKTGVGSMAGGMITDSGGKIAFLKSGKGQKETIYDSSGAAISQSAALSLTNGGYTCYVADSLSTLDCVIMAPGGQFVHVTSLVAGMNEVGIDVNCRQQLGKFPFCYADCVVASEKDTGFDLPAGAFVLPHCGVLTKVADSGITIEAGLYSSESGGDADGFIDAVSVASAVLAKVAITNGSNTLGALFEVQDSANAGDLTHEAYPITGAAAVSVTYTLSSGADTADGFLIIPYLLTN